MNILRHHGLYFLLSAFLGLAVAVACVEPFASDDRDEAVAGTLTLQVSVPGGNAMTKATASEAEKALHSLQVWAYVHGGAAEDAPVAYASQTSAGTVSLSFSKATVGLLDDDPVAIDLYVLGNAASAGKQDLGQNSTRDEVRESVISGNAVTGFGKACVETVSNDGLPMAGLLENFDITFLRYGYKNGQLTAKENDSKYDEEAFNTALGEISSLSDLQKNYLKTLFRNGDEDAANYPYKWDYAKFSPTVSITRAVSKIRFVFAKGAEVSENVEISRIEFIGGTTTGGESIGLIPEQSYLFPLSEVKPLEVGYESIFWPEGEGKLVEAVPRVNPLPQTYDASLDENAAVKTIYLRESDLPLKGRIRYKRGNTPLMASFDLVALVETFPRNSTFTVYAYYTGGEMNIQLSVEVDPWDKNNHRVTFEEGSIYAERKFIIDQSTAQAVVPIRVDPNDPNSEIARYDVYLKPNSPVKGSLTILTPKLGTLIIIKKEDPIGSFVVTPQMAEINVDRDGGHIEISIDRSASGGQGASMTLSFGVEWPGREANADSELIDDKYRFVL